MDSKPHVLGVVLVLGLLIITGCGAPTPEPAAGLPNPASAYCEEQGYILEMRTGADGGTYGVCKFPDGSECEEWAFYRGECKPAAASEVTLEATPTGEPTAEEGPTTTPEPIPTETAPSMRDVAYEGISFTLDDAVAADIVAQMIPATDEQGPPLDPAHVHISLNGYVLPKTFHQPRVLAYPVAELEMRSEYTARRVSDLRQLLVDKPVDPQAIPFLPLFPAGQMLRAQVAYVDFQNGAGVRFLTQYAQAYLPINNYELFYTFQGLTDDGGTYVAAILPASHPALPADQAAYEGDLDTLVQNFDPYIAEIAQLLDAQDVSSFTPDLSRLDAMIRSLDVVPDWTMLEPPETELEAALDVPATLPTGAAVPLHFTLTNTTHTSLYILKWYTPLEGIAGEIFRVERGGQVIPYAGILATRAAPTRDNYVLLSPGESASAEVDLATAYDFSQAGVYTIEFISPRISHVARTEAELAKTLDDLHPVQIGSEPVTVEIAGSTR